MSCKENVEREAWAEMGVRRAGGHVVCQRVLPDPDCGCLRAGFLHPSRLLVQLQLLDRFPAGCYSSPLPHTISAQGWCMAPPPLVMLLL